MSIVRCKRCKIVFMIPKHVPDKKDWTCDGCINETSNLKTTENQDE